MVITDRIYGTFRIESPVLLDLINSEPVQRLKGIAQFGIPDEYYHIENFSRYEHSVGVMLLLKILGASEEEQIAGLLHDVSHTAFSHMIDWVIGSGATEDYQDEQHEQFILKSVIPAILKKHGYDPHRITNYHHFGLLERDTPDLCADRIDYSLHEFPQTVAKKCLNGLTTQENRIVMKNPETALLFAKHFLKQQMTHWGGFEAVSRYRIFADIIRIALKDNLITMEDFWRDDEFVLNKLKSSKNSEIQRRLLALQTKSLVGMKKSKSVVHKKFRHVDPYFIAQGSLARLSKVDPTFAELLQNARTKNERGIRVAEV